MPIELKIPAVGESITEVQIGEWLKSEGDLVKQDEPVAVIDSEKTTFELPAPQTGRLSKILHQAGETVSVGAVVGQLELDGGESKAAPSETDNQAAKPKAEPKKEPKAQPKPEKPAASTVPADMRAAQTEGEGASPADLEEKKAPAPKTEAKPKPETKEGQKPVPANRPSARQPARGQEPSAGGAEDREETVPMTMLRRTAAQRLVEAQQTMAMLTTFNEVDMSAVQALRHEFQEAFEKRHQVKLGLMSFFIKAAAEALKQFPQLNAEIRGTDIIYRNYFDIGVAVATDRGLVVPVLRDAQRLSFAGLEKAIGDFGRRAKEGRLKPDELEGGTFTITNGGVFGSLLSTPIINPPQTGILGLHSIQDRPVVLQGQIVARPMMYIALTYDHRLVDGREAVMFLRRIKQAVENPARILIEV